MAAGSPRLAVAAPSGHAFLAAAGGPSAPPSPLLRQVKVPMQAAASHRGAASWLPAASLLTAFAAKAIRRHHCAAPRRLRIVRQARGGEEAAAAGGLVPEPELERDHAGRTRLRYRDEGWSRWTWAPEGAAAGPFECHYVAAGPTDGPPLVLVHGFGASSYHWRYQVPALAARGFRVYAPCLLGYGWAPRTVLRYSGEVWAEQLNAFVCDVVGVPAVLAGNSVGAFASLLAAAFRPEQCRGLVLLNAAGRFEERQPGTRPARKQPGDIVAQAAEDAEPGPVQWLLGQITRAIAAWAFWTTKLRIQPILEWVYVNGDQVDEDLVKSIRTPAEHPDALDTFGQVIQAGRRTEVTVFEALDKLPQKLPLLLLWGMQDPWMRPERAHAILDECAERGLECRYVELDAGHCPQDDAPDAVNATLLEWLEDQSLLGAPAARAS